MPPKEVWDSMLKNHKRGVMVLPEKEEAHTHKCVGLTALKFAFTKGKSVKKSPLEIDSMIALAYLVQMGETCRPEMLQSAKEIWDYVFAKQISVTAEYLPSIWNVQADLESRKHNNLSDWKRDPNIRAVP